MNQTRSYAYDARGYLLSEDLPEITGNSGLVTYKVDALGLPREIHNGLNLLNYNYDTAARLLNVKKGSTTWSSFTYASTNSGSNRQKGKLVQAFRHNEPAAEDVNIFETYEYSGLQGSMSRKVTKIQYPDQIGAARYGATFEQTFAYDKRGLMTSQTLPKCITTPESGNTPCSNDGNDSAGPIHS